MADLSPEALTVLKMFSQEFIQSCFNREHLDLVALLMPAFFSSVLRDIRMERSKVRPTDNVRCLVLSRFFIDYFLILRSKSSGKNEGKVPEGDNLALGLVAELAEMESVRWVVMRMKSCMDDKPVPYKELQASIDCFTSIVRHLLF